MHISLGYVIHLIYTKPIYIVNDPNRFKHVMYHHSIFSRVLKPYKTHWCGAVLPVWKKKHIPSLRSKKNTSNLDLRKVLFFLFHLIRWKSFRGQVKDSLSFSLKEFQFQPNGFEQCKWYEKNPRALSPSTPKETSATLGSFSACTKRIETDLWVHWIQFFLCMTNMSYHRW